MSAEAVRDFISRTSSRTNHDLDRALAVAIQRALENASATIALPDLQLKDRFEPWFSLWGARLRAGLENAEQVASLFYSDDKFRNPVALAAASTDDGWQMFKPVVLRWADLQQRLEKYHKVDVSVGVLVYRQSFALAEAGVHGVSVYVKAG